VRVGRISRAHACGFAFVAIAAALAVPGLAAAANGRDEPARGSQPAKLDGALAAVARAATTGRGVSTARAEGLAVAGGKVRVVVESLPTQESAVSTEIVAAGGFVETRAGRLLQAYVPPSSLPGLAAYRGASIVRRPYLVEPLAISSEGVAGTNADDWQAAGIDGTGVKVAIIDLGFQGYAASQAAGELPASITTIDRCGGRFATATVHGTGVAEIVHDVAPGAALTLICVDTEVELALAAADAKAAGIRIVNHSVGWFNTSRGDGGGGAGTPDAIVADARAHGILWLNAAGNQAAKHWSGTFLDAGGTGGTPEFHAFAGPDDGNDVTVVGGETITVALKWDAWPTTAQDYDLYLYRASDPSLPVAEATSDQSSSTGPPVEALTYTNTGATDTFEIAIHRFSASQSPRLDLFYVGRSPLQYAVAAGSVLEPASSPHALAVGAVCWQGSTLATYSSQGPTIDGRTKPDLVAPDSVSSGTYGPSSSCQTSGFAGTSAASPHVAGVAALILDDYPTLTESQLRALVLSDTQDLGAAGADSLFGAGKLTLPTAGPTITQASTASGSTSTTITPVGRLDTKGAKTTYRWEYGTTVSYGSTTPIQTQAPAPVPVDVATPIGSLAPTTEYHARLIATNVFGTATGPDIVVTTTAPPPPPPPPSGGGGGGSVDLALTGSVAPASAPVGSALTWTLRLTNKTGATALGVYVDVRLPSGVTLAGSSTDRGPGCASTGAGTLRCGLDFLSSVALVGTITLVTNVTAAGELVLTGTAFSEQGDTSPADDTLTLRANLSPVPASLSPPPPAPTPRSPAGSARTGTARADLLRGGAGPDTLYGRGGADRLFGFGGADRLFGEAGDDTLTGGTGSDVLDGGTGRDTIAARDGARDTVRCGTGRDTVTADRVDRVAKDCETVRRS
jgi:uncharacterized repeat protein (TIGR01451 family)